jgi:preprotein translocase YajC subunit
MDYLPFVLLAVFAVLLWNQSRNRKKQAQQLAAALEPGCEVMLSSGIFAVVEAIADDRVIVTTAGSTKLEVVRGAIVRVTKSAAESKPAVKTPAATASRAAAKRSAPAAKKPAAKAVKK